MWVYKVIIAYLTYVVIQPKWVNIRFEFISGSHAIRIRIQHTSYLYSNLAQQYECEYGLAILRFWLFAILVFL